MIAYKPDHFTLEELVHPQIIKAIGGTNSWLRLDSGALKDLQILRTSWYLRHKSGIYINRIDLGIDSRGLRPPDDPDGGMYSTHKQGGTFDLEPVNGKHELFYHFCQDMIATGGVKYFNTMEDRKFTPTWSHLARMNHNKKILIIKP